MLTNSTKWNKAMSFDAHCTKKQEALMYTSARLSINAGEYLEERRKGDKQIGANDWNELREHFAQARETVRTALCNMTTEQLDALQTLLFARDGYKTHEHTLLDHSRAADETIVPSAHVVGDCARGYEVIIANKFVAVYETHSEALEHASTHNNNRPAS